MIRLVAIAAVVVMAIAVTNATCDTCLPKSDYGNEILQNGNGQVVRTELTYNTMTLGTDTPVAPVDYTHMQVPDNAKRPKHTFEGTLELLGEKSSSVNFQVVGGQDALIGFLYSNPLRQRLPEIKYDLVQHGSHIIPATRGSAKEEGFAIDTTGIFAPNTNVLTSTPYETALEPGRCWQEVDDDKFTRCSMPFAITEFNMNCVFNGVLSFLFNDEGVSKVWFQIVSETCTAYSFDMFGLLNATYTRHAVTDALSIRANYETEVANRLPTRPLSALAQDFPGAQVDRLTVSAFTLQPRAGISFTGVVLNGIHYTSEHSTRAGFYPFPAGLVLPSWSVSKTALTAVTALAIEQAFPLTSVLSQKFVDLAPYVSALTAPGNDWSAVTVRDLIDMASGHYNRIINFTAGGPFEDEATVTPFWLLNVGPTIKRVLALAYPKQAEPGTKFAYHTTDHFLAMDAMQAFVRVQTGNATLALMDWVNENVYQKIGGSPVLQVARTLNPVEVSQFDQTPLGGLGLFLLPDDAAKLGLFYGKNNGAVGTEQILAPAALADAKAPSSGLPVQVLPYKYRLGTWKLRPVHFSDPGCGNSTSIGPSLPFMDGLGGNHIVMFPQGAVFYEFQDQNSLGGRDVFSDLAYLEVLRLEGSCARSGVPQTAAPSTSGVVSTSSSAGVAMGVVAGVVAIVAAAALIVVGLRKKQTGTTRANAESVNLDTVSV